MYELQFETCLSWVEGVCSSLRGCEEEALMRRATPAFYLLNKDYANVPTKSRLFSWHMCGGGKKQIDVSHYGFKKKKEAGKQPLF